MIGTVYISSGNKGKNIAEILNCIIDLCTQAGFESYVHQFDNKTDDPNPLHGEVIECRVDKLITSDLLIGLLNQHFSEQVMSDLWTAKNEKIPTIIAYQRDLVPLFHDLVAENRITIEYENVDDMYLGISHELSKWKHWEELTEVKSLNDHFPIESKTT